MKIYKPVTKEAVLAAHKNVVADSKYGSYGDIDKILWNKYGKNDDIAIIALKIAFIDQTNSTNFRMNGDFTIAHLASYIASIDFDNRVKRYDSNLVEEIASANKNRRNLSLASKYCTYHNYNVHKRDDYAIFDSVVKEGLAHYLKQIDIKIKKYLLDDYANYYEAIDKLIEHYSLGELKAPRRYLDHFIWWNNRK
jgi:hypothetical protein